MPKIVDWDARRDEILSATWRVIARDGITGATIRAIAREANCSRGILAHYFDDKADILGSALVMSHRRVVARMNARADGLTGLAALRVVMLEALPLDGQRLLEAQVEMAFLSLAVGNDGLRQLHTEEFERFWDVLHYRVGEAQKLGQIPPGADPTDITHELVILVEGLSQEAVLYPTRATPARQCQTLTAVLDRIAAPAGGDAAGRRGSRPRAAAQVPAARG